MTIFRINIKNFLLNMNTPQRKKNLKKWVNYEKGATGKTAKWNPCSESAIQLQLNLSKMFRQAGEGDRSIGERFGL